MNLRIDLGSEAALIVILARYPGLTRCAIDKPFQVGAALISADEHKAFQGWVEPITGQIAPRDPYPLAIDHAFNNASIVFKRAALAPFSEITSHIGDTP